MIVAHDAGRSVDRYAILGVDEAEGDMWTSA
jgi:hypothetical protein